MITIVDYGLGNLASIRNMIKKVGGQAEITADIERISQASKIIIPGVGSFGQGMKNLEEKGLVPVLHKKALEEKVPVFGICLGMQLMTLHSEEGDKNGLSWIQAKTKRFNLPGLKVPHMGWSDIIIKKKDHPLFRNASEENRFYFVHSYAVHCETENNILAQTEYGYLFDSMIVKDNIMGCQFHPEKSHKFGMNIMRNFIFEI